MTDLDPSELETITALARSGDIRREDSPVILRMASELASARRVVEASKALQDARHRANRYVMRVGEYVGQDWKKATHFALFEKAEAASVALDAALADAERGGMA